MSDKVNTVQVRRKNNGTTRQAPRKITIVEPEGPGSGVSQSKSPTDITEPDDDDDDDDDKEEGEKEDGDAPGEDTIISDDELLSDDEEYDDTNTTRYFLDLHRLRYYNESLYKYPTLILNLRTMFSKFEEGEVVPPRPFLSQVDEDYKQSLRHMEEMQQSATKQTPKKRKARTSGDDDFIEDDVEGQSVFDISAFFSVAGNSAILLPRSHQPSEPRKKATQSSKSKQAEIAPVEAKSSSTTTPAAPPSAPPVPPATTTESKKKGDDMSDADNIPPPTKANGRAKATKGKKSTPAEQSPPSDDTDTAATVVPVKKRQRKQTKAEVSSQETPHVQLTPDDGEQTQNNRDHHHDGDTSTQDSSQPDGHHTVDPDGSQPDDDNMTALLQREYIHEHEIEPYIQQLFIEGLQIIQQNIDKITIASNIDTLSQVQHDQLQQYRPDLLQNREITICKPSESKSLCPISIFKSLHHIFTLLGHYYTTSVSHRNKATFVARLHENLWVLGSHALQTRFRQKPSASNSTKKVTN